MGPGPTGGRCAPGRSPAIVTAMNAISCVAAAGLWGVLAGWWTPRGPLTITQALCSVVISAAIGWAAGRSGRSRWMLLAVPAVFVVALELVRIGRQLGPSADLPHLSVFGVLVLLAGRGVQGRVTLDRVVTDILAVTDYLRGRFGQERVYLLGHSGGSILSVLAVTRHPEKFHAYIGAGQAVDLLASDRIFYDDIRAWARTTGRPELDRHLERQGPPPYDDVWGYEPFMLYENQAYKQQDLGLVIGVREYTLLQKVHTINAILDSWHVLYPRMQDVDLRRDVPGLPIPAYFVQGSNEMRGLSELFDPWYEQLAAPRKELIVVPGGGHRAIFEQPAVLVATMNRVLTLSR
jgi:pimeloyl-ACP methyl ester carboxylesterase